ncbi:MAG TPA: ubiquinol-cytochrome C chaperone family protein [Methylotenera sp.]
MEFVDQPNNIIAVLKVSDVEDIDILVDYITDNGKGRIALSSDVCAKLINAKQRRIYTHDELLEISYEIRRFGGNTLANLYRDARTSLFGHTNPLSSALDKILPDSNAAIDYQEVVIDIASKLKTNYSKGDSVLSLEDAILGKLLSDSFAKMTPEERKAVLDELGVRDLSMLKPGATAAAIAAGKFAGFATYKIALIVANAISRALLGKGLTFATNAMLTRTIGVVLGPVGWVITGLWTIADMASPAYRVTVPCVVQLAYMRQKAIMKELSISCGECKESNNKGNKFCSGCGSALS